MQAITSSSGASAAAASSNRTWSLPLKVAPWAIACARCLRAISTIRLAINAAMSCRKILALVDRAGLHHREDEIGGELFAQVVDATSDAPVLRPCSQPLGFLLLPDVGAKAITSAEYFS